MHFLRRTQFEALPLSAAVPAVNLGLPAPDVLRPAALDIGQNRPDLFV